MTGAFDEHAKAQVISRGPIKEPPELEPPKLPSMEKPEVFYEEIPLPAKKGDYKYMSALTVGAVVLVYALIFIADFAKPPVKKTQPVIEKKVTQALPPKLSCPEINSRPQIKYKTRWKTKYVVSPRLIHENRWLRAQLRGE